MISKKSSPKQKRHELTPFLVVLLLLPYIVGFAPDTLSSYTQFSYGAGTGKYVYHDCSGTHSQNFIDAGLYVGKKFEGPYRVGLSAGGVAAGHQSTGILFPDLALDWRSFSIGTTGLRIGSQDNFYFESKWFDQPPLFSGKGAIRTGIGGKLLHSDTHFWFGMNFIPYNKVGLATQVEFPLESNSYVFLNGRYGMESRIEEFGISAGVRIMYH